MVKKYPLIRRNEKLKLMDQSFSPRERFARMMAHQPADRVPIDLDGTSLTSLSSNVAAKVKAHLKIAETSADGNAAQNERLLEALEVDFRRVGGLIASGDRPIPGKPGFRSDMWGVVRAWTGQYWDIVHSPLKGATIQDLEAFPWPDAALWIHEAELERYQAEARRLWERTGYVVVAEHPVYGVFELACWMCGFDDFLWRLAGDQPFVRAFFTKALDLQKRFIEPYYRALGPFIHLTTSGDDFGMQTGPFMSPTAFHRLILPYFSERIAFTRQFTPAYYWHHSCGSVYDLLPDLIEAGVDILNPIQPGAFRMEPERLKADFGDRLVFHGGFDTQNVLPFGTVQTIENEVRRVMDALKPGGGFIFSAAHNIQDDVPPENVLTLFRAAKQFGQY
jgi:uroporphyrinogen decarboxylase